MFKARSPGKAAMFLELLLAACIVGCTQSETPLSGRAEGFLDHYLLGQWREYSPSDDGTFEIGQVAYSVRLNDDDNLRIVQFDDAGAIDRVYAAYSTRLNGRKYVNVRVTDCPGCTTDERARLDADSCPYMIVQYSTFLPRSLVSADFDEADQALLDTLMEQAAAARGQFLFVVLMDSEYVEDAILGNEITGSANCDNCLGEGPCISTRGKDLWQFVRERDRNVYSPDAWSILIRDREN